MYPARCASFFSSRLRNNNPAEASKQRGRSALVHRLARVGRGRPIFSPDFVTKPPAAARNALAAATSKYPP